MWKKYTETNGARKRTKNKEREREREKEGFQNHADIFPLFFFPMQSQHTAVDCHCYETKVKISPSIGID